MPTGYTCAIKDGISFDDFVMRCARAFGALVDMRDESLDAPIPEKFEPSNYHQEKIKELEEEKAKLKKKLESGAHISECELEYEKAVEVYEKSVKNKTELRARYLDMLHKVREWVPPTDEHVELKRFMVNQLNQSIDFDCDTSILTIPKLLTPTEWFSQKMDRILNDILYHREEYLKEVLRVADRNVWLKALRDSLKKEK